MIDRLDLNYSDRTYQLSNKIIPVGMTDQRTSFSLINSIRQLCSIWLDHISRGVLILASCIDLSKAVKIS